MTNLTPKNKASIRKALELISKDAPTFSDALLKLLNENEELQRENSELKSYAEISRKINDGLWQEIDILRKELNHVNSR